MTTELTREQQQTFDNLVSFGFDPVQSHHAALRYGPNSEGAANWLIDNPTFDFSNSPVVDDYRPTTPTTTTTEDPSRQDVESEERAISPPPPPPPPPSTTTNRPPPTRRDVDDDDNDEEISKALALSMESLGTEGIDPRDLDLARRQQQDHVRPPRDVVHMAKMQQLERSNPLDRVRGRRRRRPEEGEEDDVVTLRTISPVMTSVASYLQCLYSVPTWQNVIFKWTSPVPPSRQTTPNLEGVWKGQTNLVDDDDDAADLDREQLERVQRIESIQRLFALMRDSVRSFVHVEEVVKAFDLRQSEFIQGSGIDRIKQMHRQLVQDLQATTTSTKPLEEVTMTSGGRPLLTRDEVERSFLVRGRRVVVGGRQGLAHPHPREEEEEEEGDASLSTEMIELEIDSLKRDPRQSFIERIDHVLLGNNNNNNHLNEEEEEEEEYRLVKEPFPNTLMFHLSRHVELTSLDDLSSPIGIDSPPPYDVVNANVSPSEHQQQQSTTTTSSRGGARGRSLLSVEPELWLDRYDSTRDVEQVRSRRREFLRLEQRYRRVVCERDRVAFTSSTSTSTSTPEPASCSNKEKRQDAVKMVRDLVDYLEEEQRDEQDERVDMLLDDGDDDDEAKKDDDSKGETTRRERRERLRNTYRAILNVMETKLKDYETELETLEIGMRDSLLSPSSSSEPEAEDKDRRRIGPYRIVAMLSRNGLNGKGSTWSIVKRRQTSSSEEGWIKVYNNCEGGRRRRSPGDADDDGGGGEERPGQVETVETGLDRELKDRTGLNMDAGISLVFYQVVTGGDEEAACAVPDDLKRAVAKDNRAFARKLLSSSSTHDQDVEVRRIVAGWDIDLKELSDPEDEDEDEVIPIAVERAEDVVDDITLSPPPPPPAKRREVEDVGMVDAQGQEEDEDLEPLIPPPPRGDEEGDRTLRLRGGATIEGDDDSERDEAEEEEDDEDDEDDFIDEDEVELGLLRPMPPNRDEWDIDYAVGKVGGTPVWLDPRSPLTTDDVECRVCHRTMALLVQVNSPDDSRPHAEARSLYVFACRRAECVARDSDASTCVWRTQMQSPNEFFPHTEESISRRRRLELALEPSLGLSTTTTTTTEKPTTTEKTKPWPEWDIEAEPEPYEESFLPDPSAPKPEQAEGEDADAPDTISGVDREFLVFQERIEREPRQVLRFYRLPDVETPEPLWTSHEKVSASSVAPCELCRGPREVEFQVLSTVLSRLGDDEPIEFGSLLVYTCRDNCEIPARFDDDDDDAGRGGGGGGGGGGDGEKKEKDEMKKKRTGWAREIVYKQDFTTSGVKFGFT